MGSKHSTKTSMIRFLLALLLTAAAAPGQAASYTYFGAGCSVRGPQYAPSALTATGVPRLGASITLQYSSGYPIYSKSSRHVLLLTGTSRTSAFGLRLPYVTGPGTPGPCAILCSPDVILPMLPGPLTMRLDIPNDAALLGFTLYQQFLAYYADWGGGSYDTWTQTSNGGVLVVGS